MPAFTRINSYAHAHQHAQETRPFTRGTYANLWPMTFDRRKPACHMYLANDPAHGRGYHIKMHRTVLAEYYEDGFVRLRTYSSTTTCQFADYILPYGVAAQMHRGVLYYGMDGVWYEGEMELQQNDAPHGFARTFRFLTPPKSHGIKARLDRRLAAAVRKLPFVQAAQLTYDSFRLLGNGVIYPYPTSLVEHGLMDDPQTVFMSMPEAMAFWQKAATTSKTVARGLTAETLCDMWLYSLCGAVVVEPLPPGQLPPAPPKYYNYLARKRSSEFRRGMTDAQFIAAVEKANGKS